jgi:hypothetical protein
MSNMTITRGVLCLVVTKARLATTKVGLVTTKANFATIEVGLDATLKG